MSAIRIDSVTKVFPDGSIALKDLALEIEPGETMVLIGPSGCGKTTTLRLIAGLDHPTEGAIWLGSTNLAKLAPDERRVAMMFQSDALYQHMSVRGNLSFGLKARQSTWAQLFGTPFLGTNPKASSGAQSKAPQGPSVQTKIDRVARRLGIERLLDRKPHQLSGGERQRVALGRALVREPAVFLLDEPLSRLDARLAGGLRSELRREFRELGIPVLYVTHNQREAFALADRIAVMHKGEILQVGRPLDVYRRPVNRFVANFVGESPINFLPLTKTLRGRSDIPESADSLGIRPEHLSVLDQDRDSSDSITLPATVRDIEWLGDRSLVRIACQEGGLDLMACAGAGVNMQAAQPVVVGINLTDAMFFDSAGRRVEAST